MVTVGRNKPGKVIDPRKLMNLLWPDITLYKEQWDVVYSIQGMGDDYLPAIETFVPAGNMLGKP